MAETFDPPPPGSCRIRLNGEQAQCSSGLLLPDLLRSLGYRPELVVVEFNGEILPRQRWGQQLVADGDQLEVVTIVGGG
jgi:sulfur carrier protein